MAWNRKAATKNEPTKMQKKYMTITNLHELSRNLSEMVRYGDRIKDLCIRSINLVN